MNANTRAITTVGVVGWGRMGGTMGTHALRRGWPVTAFDPSPEAAAAAAAAGATAVATAADVAAASDLVLLVVVDDEQVRQAVVGRGGALETARPGTVLAVCASVRPDTCVELADAADERDVHLIDVPLVGGERGAEAGALKLMCGGRAAAVDACLQAFSAFAIDVCHVGDVGTGQVAKTANNLLLWACVRANYGPCPLPSSWVCGQASSGPSSTWAAERTGRLPSGARSACGGRRRTSRSRWRSPRTQAWMCP
jgi:3-hydroxyisobutyrate dehydrogenase-like beta-hydroxyacid dehydrogenase